MLYKDSHGYAKVSATLDSLGHLCGISAHDLYLYPKAAIEAFQSGKKKILQILGNDMDVFIPYTTPVIKYGHLNSLGLKLNFPKDGDVAPAHSILSLNEVRSLLEEESTPWNERGMTPGQLRYLKTLKKAFPGERVHWGWQWEGPVTTAWALLGQDFFFLPYDDPEGLRDILMLCARSLNSYIQFYNKVDEKTLADPFPDYGRLCDDIAAMISPRFWESHVMPCWEQFFNGPVPDKKLHCEDLKHSQLEFLNTMKISDFDAGISPLLNPEILERTLNIPFTWRLGSFHYQEMSLHDIEQFVCRAAKSGSTYVFTFIEPIMLEELCIEKVRHFYKCGQVISERLASGSNDFTDMIDNSWDWKQWCGYKEKKIKEIG